MNKQKPLIVISGGSRGLGYALVQKALTCNYNVATFSRSKTPLIAALEADPSTKNRFWWQAIDINQKHQLEQFIFETIDRFGEIDALINNAGVATGQLLTLTQTDDLKNMININLLSNIVLTQLCTKSMLRNATGAIVNISSIAGIQGQHGVACYGATKAALDGLTINLAKELGPNNIRVNSVAPGYFESDMVAGLTAERKQRIQKRTPLKKLATTTDVVNAVFFLISAQAACITGQVLAVDGGFTC